MNRYQVRTRYAGSILLEVEAENKDQAQGLAEKIIQSMDCKTFLEALEPQKLDTEITQLNEGKNHPADHDECDNCNTKINMTLTFFRSLKMETKITKLDRDKIKYIRKRMESVLKPLADELGIVIDICNCTFQSSNCRFQLKVAVLDSGGKPVSEEIELFKCSAKLFGFEPDDMGREFIYRGKTYTICGLNPKSRKYPVIAKAVNGKAYKFPCKIILKALNKQVPDWLQD